MTAHRILVAGRSGQLAQALAAGAASAGLRLETFGRPGFDLASPEAMSETVARFRPGMVINAAAYTDVDGAEKNTEEARQINEAGAGHLARIAKARNIPIMHISTDCVFDGSSPDPYTETDMPRPLGAYGRSKLAGELAVAATNPRHLIVRVSWVFSPYGRTFVRTMLDLADTRDEVTVVSDQIGYPTHADDLAGGLLSMARHCLTLPDFDAWGIYHLAGPGETDRARMAEAVFADSHAYGGPVATVKPVLTSDYPTPARRPLNARLGSDKAGHVFGLRLPHWRARLTDCVRALLVERQRA